MAQKDENWIKVTYHCYDCGGIWDKNGVDIFQTKDLTKYICKECRGRCLPEEEIGKVKGVKSIRQRFGSGKITLIILLVILVIISLDFYYRRVKINDYRNYLNENIALRTIINSKLETYGEDYKLLQKAKKEKINTEVLKKAQERIATARKYISARDVDIENMKKPETSEVFELYISETTFWRDPSYSNFIKYHGTFNRLLRKYRYDYFDLLKEKVKKRAGKKKPLVN